MTILCTRNIKDTQCGFKLFTRKAAQTLFGSLHLERWAFDIELIYVAELLDIPLTEVLKTAFKSAILDTISNVNTFY